MTLKYSPNRSAADFAAEAESYAAEDEDILILNLTGNPYIWGRRGSWIRRVPGRPTRAYTSALQALTESQ